MNTILSLLKNRPELNYNLQLPKIDTSFANVFKEDNTDELQKIALLQQLNNLDKQVKEESKPKQNITYNITIQNKKTPVEAIKEVKKRIADKIAAKQKQIKISNKDEQIVKEAANMINKPYIWGASPNSNKGADCSSLVCKAVYKAKKLQLPRTAQDQWKSKIGQKINNPKNMKKGDVLYFNFPNKRGVKVSHTAIYAGNGEFIEASNAFGKVVKRKIPKRYLSSRYLVGIKRF